MDSLIIENPVRLTDTSFKITINGQDFEYEISEEKDIDAVIDKLNNWIDRGEESFGGLYDYIKRTFKLVGEYEEPIEEAPEDVIGNGPELVDIPSDSVDVDEPVANQLDINVNVEDKEVTISINEWSAIFTILDDDDTAFTDMLEEYINDEMTLKDRTDLIVELARKLQADDPVDFYNLFNLILDTGVDIINSFDEVEEEPVQPETPAIEEPTEDLNTPVEEPVEEPDFEESEKIEGNQINENFYEENTGEEIVAGEPAEEVEEEPEEITLDDLVNNEGFISDLVKLDLSLFELTNKDNEKIYFIGGINNRGNKFSLSYTTEPPIELIDQFNELKNKEVCLNNIEDLNMVVDYINKLLDIVYNKELTDMEDSDE